VHVIHARTWSAHPMFRFSLTTLRLAVAAIEFQAGIAEETVFRIQIAKPTFLGQIQVGSGDQKFVAASSEPEKKKP
jgi:hypothetical protein